MTSHWDSIPAWLHIKHQSTPHYFFRYITSVLTGSSTNDQISLETSHVHETSVYAEGASALENENMSADNMDQLPTSEESVDLPASDFGSIEATESEDTLHVSEETPSTALEGSMSADNIYQLQTSMESVDLPASGWKPTTKTGESVKQFIQETQENPQLHAVSVSLEDLHPLLQPAAFTDPDQPPLEAPVKKWWQRVYPFITRNITHIITVVVIVVVGALFIFARFQRSGT